MANKKKLTPCEWCLEQEMKVYGSNNTYESEDLCAFRRYCSCNSLFGKKINESQYNEDFVRNI